MRVVLSRFAGACYGVQRALDLAESAILGGEPAVTLGPIIHNPKVVKHLSEQGIRPVSSLDEAHGDIVIIRSHGVSPEVMDQIKQRGLEMIDATCPHVARAQKAAEELALQGCTVVVVGEAGHPEVESLTAYARKGGARTFVVKDPADLPEDVTEPVGVVVQTTQTREALDAVVSALVEKGFDPQVSDTICFATRQRQDAAAALSTQVDAMVIIGGKNSSNTTRLFEICQAVASAAYHIEDISDIDPAWFEKCATVGVSAGASTPEEQIRELIDCLEQM